MALPVGERILEAWEQLGVKSIGPIVKTSTYKNLKQGAKILIDDPYWPQFRGIRFIFTAFCFNVESGVGYIEAYGGKPGHQAIMAFPVHAARVLT